MDLSSLSAVSTGFQQGELREAQIDEARQRVAQQKLASQQAQDDQMALAALGRALGVAPPDAPAPQAPGQVSQPAPQQAPPQPSPPPQPQTVPPAMMASPPPAQPPGQQGPSSPVVATSGGQPVAPPGTYMNPQGGPPPGQPPQGGPPQGQPPRPMPQQPGPQGAAGARPPGPPPGAPGASPNAQSNGLTLAPPPQRAAAPPGPIVPGQVTLQDLATRIIRANPGIEKRPDLLVRALDKGQKLLAPDEKNLLEQQKAQMTYDAKLQKLDSDQKIALQKADSAQQLATIKADFAEQKAQAAQQFAWAMAGRKDQAAGDRAEAKDERATRQKAIDAITKAGGKVDPSATTTELQKQAGDAVAAATDKKASTVDRRGLVAAATKVGVPVKADMTEEEIQNATALKTAEAAGGSMPEATKKFYGQALLAGDQQLVNSALGMSKNRVGTMGQIIEGAQSIDPNFDGKKAAAAAAVYGGQKAAAGQTAKTAANVALGANEIKRTLPLAVDAAKRLDLTKYPTINAAKNASARAGLLTSDQQQAVAQLGQYEQAVQNAYRQVIARGGRSTVFDAKQAAELLNDKMPIKVLLASGDAMIKEAAANRAAAGETLKEVTGQGDAEGPPDDAVKDLRGDPSAARQAQFDEVFGKGAAKKALGQ